ncbi:TonB-dependent copper receptor [Opitutus terrae]|uniref:TonB-dependent copper receptor n=1 Tax=Opitutus terrae (strain DSM 11246 / JCM 15787 / PB90-1) TaxID=452637 RepID=B1ZXF0_OPITP|nr:TonB-dependent copper receptor [Opitutus terrae]ACB76945.1 TonB-dependent copper receptor [Opitutus terrae PB90-1]
MHLSSRSLSQLALATLCGLAAPRSRADDVVALARVVVTASPSEHPLVVFVDPKAPAQPIPAHDGAEALRSVPGFVQIRKAGTDGDPVFRGMAGSRLGILLDGETILGGCGNRMDPPTAYVFPSAYDKITVLKGPQTVLYGPGNSAGVVLFERTPVRYPEPGATLTGALTFGSFARNDQFVDVRAGAPLGYVQAAATRTTADDYRDGSGRAVPSHYERWSTHLAAGWTPDAQTTVELSGVVSDGEAAYADRAMDGTSFDRRNLGLRVRRSEISPWLVLLEASAFVNAVDHVMDNFSLRRFTPTAMMPGRAVSNPDRFTIGGRAAATLALGVDTRVVTGLDYQENRHRLRSTRDDPTDPFATKRRMRDASFDVTGLFAEVTHLLTPADRLVAGGRLDSWRAHDERTAVAVGMGTMPNPTAQLHRDASLTSGFLRYEHDLRAMTTAYVGVGHAERFPDYWELVSKESAGSVSAFRAAPEHTTQLDVGVTHRAGSLTASLALFASRIDDYILIQSNVAKPAAMGATRMATITRNVDAVTRGGEASVSYTLGGWRADASIAGVYGRNRTDDRPLAQQPPLETRLGLSYSTPRWSLGTLARWVDAQDRFARNQGNIVGQDLGPTAGFTVFSINAGWKLHEHAQLTAGVDNLTDKTYAEHLSRGGAMVAGFPPPTLRINEPGRTFWAKLQVSF